MKQTAVEWFQEQIIDIVNGRCELSEIEIFNKAKAMEKEQMKEVAWHFKKVDMKKSNKGNIIDLEFNQYYNETFKSE